MEGATADVLLPASSSHDWTQHVMQVATGVPLADVQIAMGGVNGGAAAAAAAAAATANTPPGTQKKQLPPAVRTILKSDMGMGVLCVLATFVVALILLVAIRPPFVEKESESKFETPKLAPAKAAAGAAIAAAVTAVVVGVVGAVRMAKKANVKMSHAT